MFWAWMRTVAGVASVPWAARSQPVLSEMQELQRMFFDKWNTACLLHHPLLHVHIIYIYIYLYYVIIYILKDEPLWTYRCMFIHIFSQTSTIVEEGHCLSGPHMFPADGCAVCAYCFCCKCAWGLATNSQWAFQETTPQVWRNLAQNRNSPLRMLKDDIEIKCLW